MFENVLAGVLGNLVWFLVLGLVSACGFLSWKLRKLSGLVSRMMKSGITDFFPDRDSYTRDRRLSLEDYLQTAKTDLTYIGHWMAVSIDQRHTLDSIKDILHSGKNVGLILLSKNLSPEILASYARFFGKSEADFQFQIDSGWATLQKWKSTLGTDELKSLTIKSHGEFICHSAFVFDKGQSGGKILIDQKIWGLDRKNSFGFELSCKEDEKQNSRTLFDRYSRSLRDFADRAVVVNC